MTKIVNMSSIENTLANKPGTLALMVKEEMNNSNFKTPLPVKKIKKTVPKKTVLDEEAFCRAIDKIIQRDFFPDIEKLKTQNAYLDAVKNNDVYSLRKIYAKYSLGNSPLTEHGSVCSPLNTPLIIENELHPMNEAVPDLLNTSLFENSNSEVDFEGKKKSLDEFFANHIGEENYNFQEIIKEEERLLKQKKPWLFKEEKEKEEILKNVSLAKSEVLSITDDTSVRVKTWDYKDKNYVMFVPDGVEMSKAEKLESVKKKIEIMHGNTNFTFCPYDEEQSKEVISDMAYKQSRALEGKIGVDGKEIVLESPKINGFNFVHTPSPMPGIDATPLMTWGQIEGTPFRLDGSDTPRSAISGHSFKIAEQPKREKIAFQLAEKAGERHRDKKRKALETAKRQLAMASPCIARSPMNKFSLLSPAAKRLVSAHVQNKMDVDSSLRSSYTPKCLTPLVSPKSSAGGGASRTPKSTVTSGRSRSRSPVNKSEISTDVKRLRASDFFT